MANYEAYGPWVGGDDWRAWVGVYITKNNETTLAGRIESWVWSEYGTTSGYSNIRGAAAWDNNAWSYGGATSISQNSWKKLKEVTFSVAKGHSATSKTAWAKAEGIAGIYSGSSSQATVSVTVGAKPSYAVSYNANGGSGAPSGQTKWYGETLTLSTTRPTRTNYTFKGWAISSGGGVAYAAGATYTANAAVTLYAVWERSYTVPNAVTNLAFVRNSDSQLSATWTNNSAVPREYTAIYVEVQTDGGQWVQVAKLGATATNYTWNGATANHQYRVRVRPYNPAGYGAYATSGYVYTTPAAPSSVAVAVPSAGTVEVTVTAGAPWATSHVVQVTADGGETWSAKGTVAGAGGTYADTNPPTGTCQYRARAVIGTLHSDWAYSEEIVTLCPPLAPTITQRPAAAIATGSAVTLGWLPNHPDRTEQTQAQVEVTAGGSTTTIAITGDTTSVDLSSYAETAQSVSVRVRTYGLYAEWGAWSDVVAFTAYVPPSAAITAPSTDEAVERQLPVTIAWSAVDATGISSQVLRLFDGDGRQLRSWQLDGSVRSFDLDRASYFLTNGASYSITLVVSAGSTLQATATRAFSIDYLGPAEPTADVVWDEDALSCAVTVAEGIEDGAGTLPHPTSFYVVRVLPDGTEWLVADGLSSSQQAIDPLPPLGVEFAYRVVAVAESGVETAAEFAAIYDTNAWAFGFGQGVAETVLLLADPSASESWEHGGETYHFADGSGDGLPLWYGTDVLEVSHSWSFAIPPKWADVADHAASLFRRFSTCWVRDPFGNRWRVFAKASMTVKPGPRWSVSVNADELRWTEAS